MKEVAIYHYTNKSIRRPKKYQRQIKVLEAFSDRPDWHIKGIFCDVSTRESEHPEFVKLLENIDEYDVLVVKDFYHLNYFTKSCMTLLHDLQDKGIEVYSHENGCFLFNRPPLDEPLRIATYFGRTKCFKSVVSDIQQDIYKHFVMKKTKWEIVDAYIDEKSWREDSTQPELRKLIANKDKYDLILVYGLGAIHWRTAKFCTLREELKKDIYSLQDGYLKYQKEEF